MEQEVNFNVEKTIRETKQRLVNIIEQSPLNAAIIESILQSIELEVKNIVDRRIYETDLKVLREKQVEIVDK